MKTNIILAASLVAIAIVVSGCTTTPSRARVTEPSERFTTITASPLSSLPTTAVASTTVKDSIMDGGLEDGVACLFINTTASQIDIAVAIKGKFTMTTTVRKNSKRTLGLPPGRHNYSWTGKNDLTAYPANGDFGILLVSEKPSGYEMGSFNGGVIFQEKTASKQKK